MSTALAIASVTAVMRQRLREWLADQEVASLIGNAVKVSVLAPDRVVVADGTEQSQLNVFLYNVSRNVGWANNGLPTHDPTGRFRVANAALGLDLHYLISAYSSSDFHAEILLGYAMQLLHEAPVFTREAIRSALNPAENPDLPAALSALADSGLADQVESVRITPQYLDNDAISKLWTATQSSYRPTAAYDVSVILIQGTQPTRPSLPVLSRGEMDLATGRDRGVVVRPNLIPPLPTIETVKPAGEQPQAVLGQTVALTGHHLGGSSREVFLTNDRFQVEEVLADSGTDVDDRMEFVIPAAQSEDFTVGVYNLTARMIRPGETESRETNRVALVVAPEINNLPQTVARDGDGDASLTLTFTPAIRQGQRVTLLLGQAEYEPEDFAPPALSLHFVVEDAPLGTFLARLRVDGIESAIIDRAATPPVFFDHTVTIT
jgi:hypothetical protein